MTAGTSIIRACSCTSPFQDARYGKGQRVHNVGKNDTHEHADILDLLDRAIAERIIELAETETA